MEDLNAYIESGILELYVLGQLTDQEKSEVEAIAAKNPDVKKEITAIELAMEKYALSNAIDSKKALNLSLFTNRQQIVDVSGKVISLSNSANKILKFALAACVALLIVSVIALFTTYNRLDEAQTQIASLNLQKQEFARNAGYMDQQNQELKLLADMPYRPEWSKISLKGVGNSPEANLVVFWNKLDNKVILNNNNKVLPSHDANHQYQLWALVDGKPIDLGVFDAAADNSKLVLEMKAISGAQAFAVTLEKLGGSATPSMDQMVVMGGV